MAVTPKPHAASCTGSTGYRSAQASKPPSNAVDWKPISISRSATRELVASLGQVQ
ncbi:MAG: hypothetical protein QF368_00885 [SAR202 cluster bacterium]|nr:hypothetical protein [SAR202 cluster bacterium]